MRKKSYLLVVFFLGSITFSSLQAQTIDKLPMKLRVGTYNVGHFNQGKLGGYQGDDVTGEMKRWRKWIGQQSMDIFFITEWNHVFDKNSTYNAADKLLKPFYNHIYFGKENKWIYNGIAINASLENIRSIQLTHDQYYAVVGDLKIGDEIITLMSVHIPWQECCHDSSVELLIDEMKKHKYLICAGDMNSSNVNQLKFADAGFNIANGGSEGWFCTSAKRCNDDSLSEKRNIDNIITSKNIKIMNVSAPHTGLSDLDHWPILSDVIITW